VAEFHSNPVEGLNYVGDTLLYAGTVLLAGLGATPLPAEKSSSPSLAQNSHASARCL